MTHRSREKIPALKISFFLFAAVLLNALTLQSCSPEATPFADVPVANTGNMYFISMCENPVRYQNMFSYLIMEHYDKSMNGGYHVDFDYNSDAFREYKRQFEEWNDLYPEYAERMEKTIGSLITMTTHIKYSSMEKNFDAMLKTVTDFIAAQFTPAADSAANYESLVSEEFLKACGADTMQKYCEEKNLVITSVEYEPYPSAVTHHYYPFSFDYSVTIRYTGEEDTGRKYIKTHPLKLRYFIGTDKNENYIIEYVADLSGVEVIPAPALPQ